MELGKQLRQCVAEVESAHSGEGITFRLSASEAGDCTTLDLDAESTTGRVTLWERGMCDVEILDVETGQRLVWKHFDHLNVDDVEQVLKVAVDSMLVASSKKAR